ncbi:hypothetical protein ACIGCM_03575 [Pseudomonas sp. NPDC078700]|uniref:hypothetical protein n=1 Tax=Pseudomonas sp. NPDC078700 TaxID=3364424 RepID=UPI0037CC882D
MAQGFLARVAGRTRQIIATVISAGAGSAGDIVALDDAGKLDVSVLPLGIGANVVNAVASEAIGAGKFVELWSDAGTLKMRLADNSNNRPAWGYVKAAVASAASGTAYRLNTVNANLSGLTPGGDYWLGTAGGVIDAALDPETDIGKMDQYLGKALSATEVVTAEFEPVYL